MKKTFTLMAAFLAAATAWAAAPELYFGEDPVVPGTVYETGYTVKVQEIGAFTMTSYTQDSDLALKGEVGKEVVVEVEASSMVQFCGLNGTCLPLTTGQKKCVLAKEFDALQIDKQTDDISGAPAEELLEDVTVKVKAYYTANPSEVSETTVVMTKKSKEDLGGIAAAAVNGSVRLSNAKTIEYNLDETAKLEIYNVNGALVMSRKIKGTGSVSLDSLHPGVYIYSAAGNTGKVLIRK